MNSEFPQEQLNNYHTRKICEFFVILRYGGSCQKSVWNDTVSWRTKRYQQLTKYQLHALTAIIYFKEKFEPRGKIVKIWSQIVVKCSYLARFGRPDVKLTVNKLARSITKWTKACDKRLSRLISCIHHTCDYKQYCHVGNTVRKCRLGLFQDSDFAIDLKDLKSTKGRTLCIFGSHTYVPNSSMCKKNRLQFRTVQQNQKSIHWTQK